MTTNIVPQPQAVIARPFTLVTALQKVRLAEDAWNSRDPHRVAIAYSEHSVWRNRSEFVTVTQPFVGSSPESGTANSNIGS